MSTNVMIDDPIAAAEREAANHKAEQAATFKSLVVRLATGKTVRPDEINTLLTACGNSHEELRKFLEAEKRGIEIEAELAGEPAHLEAVRAATIASTETDSRVSAAIIALQAEAKAAHDAYNGLVVRSGRYSQLRNELSRLNRV